MATEVLRPQDVLVNRFRVHATSFHRRRNFPANGGVSSSASDGNQQRRPSPPTKHDKRRPTAEANKSNHGGDRRRKGEISGGGLAMGQVTLLRRGESLDSLPTKTSDAYPGVSIQKSVEAPAATRGSDSEEYFPKKIRFVAPPAVDDKYAGAGFESSPSPRCLPLPTFPNMKGGEHEPFEDDATRSIRRMLRLE